MVEKRITQQLLESGELALTPLECTALALPEHSTTIELQLEGETFGAQWSGRSRQVSGDVFTERLQDYGQVGGLLRLRAVDTIYRLQLLPPGSPTRISQPTWAPTAPTKSATAQKAIRRKATVDRQFHSDDEYDWGTGTSRTTGFLAEARRLLSEQLKAAGFDPLELVELRLRGEELATLDDFEELLAVDVANVERMPHQEAVARHALSRLRGRAVLADEVGLGKTIEAGLAIKELTLRGLAKRVLILCPAPLRDQWREEMNTKFDLPFDVAYRGSEVGKQDKLILSLSLGRSEIGTLTRQPWDIVIVDEAHRAAGAGARKTRELITSLTTACRYAFFLTATPVQNDLLELYRLVELLRPGTFTSVSAFKRQYVTRSDPRTPNDPAALRRLISSAMIRTTRAQAGVDRVIRRAVDVPVELGSRERELYALSTDLLRNVMRDSADTMRRRSLALRLTASPFSMGTTALRMAERHGNERVRRVLNEIGHLALDITGSARENRALEITRDWMRDHGRVLIFTQHTDTVTGLLRRMASEGLNARAFHGSMSPSERAATIAAFRSGDTPIMISTDAGAEGQNLQFCNCVLNFDLPWNPMRIEQRIGRVDRLTQPRDEVFVANLYARGTIDESVYQLLAKKLRMFELLFGQVTTILGELDDSKSATFESRVMGALFAENDSKMERLLTELGTDLADARRRASTLIAADSGLSSWMASAFEHRKELTKAGSPELQPEVSDRARMRQRGVQEWVRRILAALGAATLHDTGDGEGAFLTVQFDEELADELGGRAVLHLAFDRHGLQHHPDAELCAVGSPVFDELLGLLRMRGDMHATVPVIPDDVGPSPLQHSPTTTLIRRRLVPSGTWSGHATFRATVGEAETTEHIITAEINGDKEIRLPRRPLKDGESLPFAFNTPPEVIAAFEREAAGQLEALRRERTERVERDQARELDRIRSGYRAQIAEAISEDRDRLRRALTSEEGRLSRRPDVRARAKLLALTLDENDWLVEETWRGPSGTEGKLTYEWGCSEPPIVKSDASLELINVLALCSEGHWVDQVEITCCSSCDHDFCSACGDDAIFADCPVCGVSSCGSCRTTTRGLCLRCGSPERAPDLDRQFATAWTLNQGAIIFVGERVAELVLPDGSTSSVIVRDEDVGDHDRARTRSYAATNGLPLDSGLILRDLTKRPNSDDRTRQSFRTITRIDVELSVATEASSAIFGSAVDALPVYPEPMVQSETHFKLAPLLSNLRRDVPPPSPPATMVTRRSTFTDLELTAQELVERVSVVFDDGTSRTLDEKSAPLHWHDGNVEDATLAEAELAGVRVSLERRNDAVLITARGSNLENAQQWIALADGASAGEQIAWFNILRARGVPGGRVGRRPEEAQAMLGAFPSPSECELVDRSIRPVVELTEVGHDAQLVVADRSSLAALGPHGDQIPTRPPDVAPAELSRALLIQAERPFTYVALNGFEIDETWRGHGTAARLYRVFDGMPVAPKLHDLRIDATDFGVCRDGHFYEAGTAAVCESCCSWACRACDEVDHHASTGCPNCSARVCRRCLSVDHPAPDLRCVLCDDQACVECGRDPAVADCPICEREMCSACRSDGLCPACCQLVPAADDELQQLPAELAIAGAAVLRGRDANATTLLIDRGGAREQVVVRDGLIDRWVAFDRHEIDSTYKVRIAASRVVGAQVIPFVRLVEAEAPFGTPHVVVRSERSFLPVWAVDELGMSGRSTQSFAAPDDALATLFAAEFPSTGALPAARVRTPPQAARAFVSSRPPRTVTLAMGWERIGRDVAITPSGISERTIEGAVVHEHKSEWSDEAGVTARWVADSWNPAPTVRAQALSNDTEAVLVRMASLLALGVRSGDCVEWFAISASPMAAAATLLSRSMGAGDADGVGTFIEPKNVRLSSVSNATGQSLSVNPVATLSPGQSVEHDNSTTDALRAWMPTVMALTPELRALPYELRAALQHRLGRVLSRTKLDIGAFVEQVVTVEGGDTWRHEVTLAPDGTDARRIDSVTRIPRTEGVIDREGHFGSEDGRCLYCGGTVCKLCAEGIVTCDCCTAAICRRCVREPQTDLWLCPACATMRPPTRSEARQYGRLLSTRRMLIGTDAQHTLVVEHAKRHWVRQGEQSEKSVIASPSVSKFLDERLAAADKAPTEP
jgi:superfamily II DNA or RNA helicase